MREKAGLALFFGVGSGLLIRLYQALIFEVQPGMPKKKTKKAAAKRFKKSARGKILFAKAGKGHLLSSKGRKRKRNLRRKGVLADAEVKRITNLLAG